MVLFRYDVLSDNHSLHNSPSVSSCVPIHHHCLAHNSLISPWATLDTIVMRYLAAYIKVEQMNFDGPILKTMLLSDAWLEEFNSVSFKSTMIILYDNSLTTVIHPTTWSQHTFVLGLLFFLGRTVYMGAKRDLLPNPINGNATMEYQETHTLYWWLLFLQYVWNSTR